MQFKKAGSKIYLLGKRKNELGASEYYRLHGHLGANVPQADFAEAQKEIYTMVDAISAGLVCAAHDISEGGLAVAVAEMAFGGWGQGKIGAEINLVSVPLGDAHSPDAKVAASSDATALYSRKNFANIVKLFGETGGFVCEVPASKSKKFEALCKKWQLTPYQIGRTTTASKLIFQNYTKAGTAPGGGTGMGAAAGGASKAHKLNSLIDLKLSVSADRWLNGLRKKL